MPDHELFDTALGWARKLAAQPPIAIEQIKSVSHKGDLDEGIAAEKQGFATVFQSADASEGISAFLQKRKRSSKGNGCEERPSTMAARDTTARLNSSPS